MKHLIIIFPILLIIIGCNSPVKVNDALSEDNSQSVVEKSTYDTLSIAEIRTIMRLAIDLPQLQEYFHVTTNPNRKPLKIKEFGLINAENFQGMTKFGEPILFFTEEEINKQAIKDYISVADWTPVNGTMRLQLSYSVEGVMVNYMFKKEANKWKITNSSLVEH